MAKSAFRFPSKRRRPEDNVLSVGLSAGAALETSLPAWIQILFASEIRYDQAMHVWVGESVVQQLNIAFEKQHQDGVGRI